MNFEKLPKGYITDIFIEDTPDSTGKHNSLYYDDAMLSAKGVDMLMGIYKNPEDSSCLKLITNTGDVIYLVFKNFNYKPLSNKLGAIVGMINLGLMMQLDLDVIVDSYEEIDVKNCLSKEINVKDGLSSIKRQDNVWVVEPSLKFETEDGQVKLAHQIDLKVFVLRDFHRAQLEKLIQQEFQLILNKVLELPNSQQKMLVGIIQDELDSVE